MFLPCISPNTTANAWCLSQPPHLGVGTPDSQSCDCDIASRRCHLVGTTACKHNNRCPHMSCAQCRVRCKRHQSLCMCRISPVILLLHWRQSCAGKLLYHWSSALNLIMHTHQHHDVILHHNASVQMPTEQAADVTVCHVYKAVDSACRGCICTPLRDVEVLTLQQMHRLLHGLGQCCATCRRCRSCRVGLHRSHLSLSLIESMCQ